MVLTSVSSNLRAASSARSCKALHDLAEEAALKFEETEVSTIGGYVTQMLGHLPVLGESVKIGDYVVTVTETDGRRILMLNFKRPIHPPSKD